MTTVKPNRLVLGVSVNSEMYRKLYLLRYHTYNHTHSLKCNRENGSNGYSVERGVLNWGCLDNRGLIEFT